MIKIQLKVFFTLSLFFLLSTVNGQQKNIDSIFNVVNHHLEENNQAEALQISLSHLKKVTEINDVALQIRWNTKIAKIFRRNHFNKAIHYLGIARELGEHTKDSLALADIYFDLGSVYLLKYSNETYKQQDINVELDKKDSALFYFRKVLNHFKNRDNTEGIVAKTYANLTGLHSYTGNQAKVEELAKNAIEYFQIHKDTIGIVGVKSNLGINYLYQGLYDKASQNYLEALPYLKDTTNMKILDIKSVNYDNLSQVYEAQGKYKLSREYLLEAQKLRVVYMENNSAKALAEIEAKFNLDVGVTKETLNTKRERVQKKNAQLWLLIISLVVVMLILLIAFLQKVYNSKTKNLLLKSTQEDLIHQQKIQHLQKKNQSKLITATLDARNEEHKKISLILHNSVSALLSSATMHLQVVKKKTTIVIPEIQKTQEILAEAIDKIRNLSHQLVSVVLIKFGLVHAIEDLCQKLSNEDLLLKLIDRNENLKLDKLLEMKVYHIIEECINNILKHSKASVATIDIWVEHQALKIEIKDDGVGFNLKEVEHSSGMGLHQINARVDVLNGKIEINSKLKSFTKISIQIPV